MDDAEIDLFQRLAQYFGEFFVSDQGWLWIAFLLRFDGVKQHLQTVTDGTLVWP